jgi:hypothetical protein
MKKPRTPIPPRTGVGATSGEFTDANGAGGESQSADSENAS